MYKWQQEVIEKMTQYKGKGLVQITGRNTGKSYWSNQAVQRLMKDLMEQPISDIKLSEGTVYGNRYYCAEPIGGNWIDMEMWCMDTFGGPGDAWDKYPKPEARWYMNNRRFWFRDEIDRMVFVLKWR